MAMAEVLIMANQVESARIGHQAISLTEFATNLEPEIAAGSVAEVGGALYEAAADEPIAGLGAIANDNQIYIKLTVAGASVTASGTLVAPTWDTAKQGWYIGGTERVIGGLYKDAGGNYTLKYLYEFMGINTIKLFGDGTVGVWDGFGFLAKKIVEIGDWNMNFNVAISVASGVADFEKIRGLGVLIRGDVGGAYEDYKLPLTALTHGVAGLYDGGAFSILQGQVLLRRIAGGVFDSVHFDATSFNRGWVTIEYEV